MPVSVRTAEEHGTYNNRFPRYSRSSAGCDRRPCARLDSIHAQMEDLKRSKEAVAGEVLTALGGFAPPMLLALAERLATRMPQHNVNTVTTNVPGPRQQLSYAAGRRMLEAFGYVPLAGTCASEWRSSPTTGTSASGSPATTTPPGHPRALHRDRGGDGRAARRVWVTRTRGRGRGTDRLRRAPAMSDVDVSVEGPARSQSGMFASALCAVDGTEQSIAAIEHAGALVGPSGHLRCSCAPPSVMSRGCAAPRSTRRGRARSSRGQRLLPQPPA